MDLPHDAVSHGHGAGLVTLLLLMIPVVLLGLYLVAVTIQIRRRRRWDGWKTASFVAGSAMVFFAFLPPLAALAHLDLRVHMLQHLLLGMLGPIGLVLGAPFTLALRTMPRHAAKKCVAVLHSHLIRGLSHPVTALVLNIGGMVALYATPLYAAMLNSPVLHFLIHVHFLAAGCLFSWAIAGIDAGPVRKPPTYRLAVLFVAMALHASLSKAMYAYGWPRGTEHGLQEIEQAAQIMYYGGDLSELILAVALFAAWSAKWGMRQITWPAASGHSEETAFTG